MRVKPVSNFACRVQSSARQEAESGLETSLCDLAVTKPLNSQLSALVECPFEGKMAIRKSEVNVKHAK